jgi:outer membrane lipoprotein carrier protein
MTRNSASLLVLTAIAATLLQVVTGAPVYAEPDASTPTPTPTPTLTPNPKPNPNPAPSADAPAAIEASCAEQVAAKVQARYDGVRNIRARFSQVTRSVMLGNASLGDDAPSTGRVQLAKPGKMRWAYESPQQSLVVSNGKVVWIYDPAAKEVQLLPVLEGYLTGAALEFLLGNGELLEEFDVRSSTCEADAKGTIELDLIPREAASYESMGMRVEVASGQLVATSLVDIFGNRTQIAFSEIEINGTMPDADFAFEVPDGVMVVDISATQP